MDTLQQHIQLIDNLRVELLGHIADLDNNETKRAHAKRFTMHLEQLITHLRVEADRNVDTTKTALLMELLDCSKYIAEGILELLFEESYKFGRFIDNPVEIFESDMDVIEHFPTLWDEYRENNTVDEYDKSYNDHVAHFVDCRIIEGDILNLNNGGYCLPLKQ